MSRSLHIYTSVSLCSTYGALFIFMERASADTQDGQRYNWRKNKSFVKKVNNFIYMKEKEIRVSEENDV